jgi:hypothetical protein
MSFPEKTSEIITLLDAILERGVEIAYLVVDCGAEGWQLISSSSKGDLQSHNERHQLLNDLLRSGARPVGFLVSRKLSDDICRLDTLPLKREWDGDPEVEGTLNRIRDRFIEGGQKRGAWLRLSRQ